MFRYHLYSTEPTEDSAVLIRELAVHLWKKAGTFAGRIGRLVNRLPDPDRETLMLYPF